MVTTARNFIKVHDGIDEHPKIEALSDKAFRHLITLWCYCGRNLTDGVVAERTWLRITTPKTARELIDNKLADEVESGYRMHDYLDHQRSRESVEALREKRQAAGKKGGEARASAIASATADAKQTRSRGEERRKEHPLPPHAAPSPPRPDRSSADADSEAHSSTFNDFWDTYPRKDNKPRAAAAWRRATHDTHPADILDGLRATLDQLTRVSDRRFIPQASTWLSDRRWTDPPQPDEDDPDSPWRAELYLPPPLPPEQVGP